MVHATRRSGGYHGWAAAARHITRFQRFNAWVGLSGKEGCGPSLRRLIDALVGAPHVLAVAAFGFSTRLGDGMIPPASGGVARAARSNHKGI